MWGAMFTLRRRLFVAAFGIVLAGGICAALLGTRGAVQGPDSAGQRAVIPHLVPDTGGLHTGSQGTSSAPRVSDQPRVRLIPSAGGPVRVYGGTPDAGTFLPVKQKH